MTQPNDKTYTWINDGNHNPEIARLVDDLDPFVCAVLAGATPLLSEISKGDVLSFAMAETTPKGRAMAVQAIYRYLHERCEMIYENEEGFREGKQFIRSQAKVGEKRVGTCIDLTLLFLACMARAKLKPLYVHLKSKSGDHAIAGVWLDTNYRRKDRPNVELKLDLVQELVEEKHFLLLEATGVTIGTPWNKKKLPFDKASKQGAALLKKHQHQGFAVDIDAAWAKGFWPHGTAKGPKLKPGEKPRVYVSSTFEDLKEYRGKVIDAIQRLGLQPANMESYSAEPTTPLDKCLDDVRSCHLYVGLFAWRYGYIPPAQTQSITELEYRAAADNGVLPLVFLLHEDHDWKKKFIDTGKLAEEVIRLRQELQIKWLVDFFTTPDDLAAKVTVALARAEKRFQPALPSMPEVSPTPTLPASLPAPELWQSYLDSKRKDFVGRKWLFAAINKWLEDSQEKKSLLILGDPGIGKSAIVAKLLEEGNCRQGPGQALESAILQPLNHFKEPWPCYILIDALDEALGDSPCLTHP